MERRSALLCLLFLLGCQSGELDSFAIVADLRILGLAAEPPELVPGEDIVHRVLWADPNGEGREVWFAWQTNKVTFNPAAKRFEISGLQPAAFVSVQEGGETFVTPKELLTEMVQSDDQNLVVYLFLCAGSPLPDPNDQAAMADPWSTCKGESYRAVRQFERTDPRYPQRNPQIDRLLIDDTPFSAQDQGRPIRLTCNAKDCNRTVTLTAQFGTDQYQPYEVLYQDGTTELKTEELHLSYYATGGDMDDNRIRSDSASNPATQLWTLTEPGRYTLWAAAHDNRGGASWLTFQIVLEAI